MNHASAAVEKNIKNAAEDNLESKKSLMETTIRLFLLTYRK